MEIWGRYIEERVRGGYNGDIRGRYIEKRVGGGLLWRSGADILRRG